MTPNAFDVTRDVRDSRVRTRRMMAISLVAHALLITWVTFVRYDDPEEAPYFEITLLEPGEPGSAPPARAATVAATSEVEERFRRSNAAGEIRPQGQSELASQDRIASRLATLRSDVAPEAAGIGAGPVPAAWSVPAMVSGRGKGEGAAPMAMTRGTGSGAGPPLELARGGGPATSAIVPAAVAEPKRSAVAEAPARDEGMVATKRTVAGAQLAGPIADRPIMSFTRPVYPEWAKRDAVEGTVTLHFVVRPDGTVKENVLVQRTAGFEEFDENARTALRAWRFQPLPGGRTGEQWGTITFRYRLEGGG